jgi:hypothetical protein
VNQKSPFEMTRRTIIVDAIGAYGILSFKNTPRIVANRRIFQLIAASLFLGSVDGTCF